MRVVGKNEEVNFKPIDFDNDKYTCVNCYNRKEQTPVVLMMSRHSNPHHYMVIDGTKQMVYRHYNEAMAYMIEHGYVTPKQP